MTNSTISRRTLINGAVATAGAAGLAATLAGCTQPDEGTAPLPSATGGGNTTGGLVMPTYQAYDGPPADLPGSAEGVPAGFFRYPHPAPVAVDEAPGTGGTITAMAGATRAVPPGAASNQYWQELNRRLGVTLDFNISPSGEYAASLQTAMAGGDIPELVQLTDIAGLPGLLAAKFADLTEFVAGDAILDYPFLANLPSVAWRSAVFGGAIMTIPSLQFVGNNYLAVRVDLAEERGVNLEPASAAEVAEMCEGLTDPQANSFAVGQPETMLDAFAAEMFGAPNEWREEGGTFTRNYETDEYKDAIDFVAKLWKAGVCHPDSFSNAAVNEWFGSGRTSIVFNGGLGYHARLQQFAPTNPDFRIGFILPPVADGGGQAQRHLGPGYYTLTGISNGVSRDRIPELLNVLNYLASPFGTEEYQFLWYGIEGVHSNWDEEAGTPIPTPDLNVERLESAAYLARAPFVLFHPGYQYATEAMHAYQSAAIGNGIHSAGLGLHSTTEDERQPALWANLSSVRGEVIQGRKPMSAWDDAVAEWKSGGGDQMRQELEAAFAEEA